MIADRAKKKVTVGSVSGGSVGLPETRTFFFCLNITSLKEHFHHENYIHEYFVQIQGSKPTRFKGRHLIDDG